MKQFVPQLLGVLFVLVVIGAWMLVVCILPKPSPDYSQAEWWYVRTDSAASKNEGADIFYICSTETSDWVNARGDTMHFADMTRPKHRAALYGEMRGVDSLICPQTCSFYAPYYNQATMEGLLRDTALFIPILVNNYISITIFPSSKNYFTSGSTTYWCTFFSC